MIHHRNKTIIIKKERFKNYTFRIDQKKISTYREMMLVVHKHSQYREKLYHTR